MLSYISTSKDTALQTTELVDTFSWGGGAFLKPKYIGIRKKNQK